MNPELAIVWKLLSALGVGALIGIERGWFGRKEDEGDRVAGIRTFSLVGLFGGIWSVMIPHTGEWILGVVFIAFTALVIASYIYEIKTQVTEDIGITTEVALLITFSLGAWAALGYQLEALGTAVAVMAILSLKPMLHRWLGRIEVEEIYAGIQLLIISLILLPLLPDKGYGPWQSLNPYWIWWMVVLISGLSFTGYLLMKYVGEKKGVMLTALVGGLASSTAVTLSLGEFAKKKTHSSANKYMAGVLVASSVMFIRVLVEVMVVNASLLTLLWIPVIAMWLMSLGCAFWLWNKDGGAQGEQEPLSLTNPLQLATAIKFGLLLGVILFLTTALQNWVGDAGIYILSVISGLMDVDAITLSLAKQATSEMDHVLASRGIVIAVVSNTLVKAGLFLWLAGIRRSRLFMGMMLLIGLIGLLTAWLFL